VPTAVAAAVVLAIVVAVTVGLLRSLSEPSRGAGAEGGPDTCAVVGLGVHYRVGVEAVDEAECVSHLVHGRREGAVAWTVPGRCEQPRAGL
jgi:hypothetical protein